MKVDSELTLEQLGERIGKLKVGETIWIETDKERTRAFTAARVLRKLIVTKASKSGGFTITALPETP